MKKGAFKSLLFAVFCGFCAINARAAVSLFSDYGQIQNVQNYSTNPFWAPNSPYNQRLPQPVYVQGADLTAEDCFKVVQSLVSVQCMARDNCKDTTLADIRPTVMVQLSNLPGNNYVSACSGYIDSVFESYVTQYGNNIPNRTVSFPNATEPNRNLNNDNKIQNPYKQTLPQWQQEIKERSQELQELQQQNNADSEHLSANDFSETYANLSFTDRINSARADYAQYKDTNAYVISGSKNMKEWCEGEGASRPECKGYTNKQNPPQNISTPPTTYVARIRARGTLIGSHEGRVAHSGHKCFAKCGENTTDDLNTKVLQNVMGGKYYCARTNDGLLVENKNEGTILTMTREQKEQIKKQVIEKVQDQANCDGNIDNLVMIFGELNLDGDFGSLDEVLLDD